MEKRVVNGERTIPAHRQSAVVAEPGEGALDDPTAAMGRDQFDGASCQPGPQRVAVVALVGHYPRRLLPWPAPGGDTDRRERGFREPDFRRGCRVKLVSQRNTRAVDHHHPLRPLAPPGFPD